MSSGLWYCATLTSEQIAAGHVNIIRRLFADAISGAHDTTGVCLFATSQPSRAARLRESVADDAPIDADTVYFSPASISAVPHLIAQYAAQPASPPARAHAALLVGRDADWDLLPHPAH